MDNYVCNLTFSERIRVWFLSFALKNECWTKTELINSEIMDSIIFIHTRKPFKINNKLDYIDSFKHNIHLAIGEGHLHSDLHLIWFVYVSFLKIHNIILLNTINRIAQGWWNDYNSVLISPTTVLCKKTQWKKRK